MLVSQLLMMVEKNVVKRQHAVKRKNVVMEVKAAAVRKALVARKMAVRWNQVNVIPKRRVKNPVANKKSIGSSGFSEEPII
jgi:hypothetical protein